MNNLSTSSSAESGAVERVARFSEHTLKAAARAEYEATHPATDAPAGGFTRWATWDEAVQARGFLEEKLIGLRAALSVIQKAQDVQFAAGGLTPTGAREYPASSAPIGQSQSNSAPQPPDPQVSQPIRADLKSNVGELVTALEECREALELVEHPPFEDPRYGEEVRSLGERIGFGALMSSAAASWRKIEGVRGGWFVAGPCHATVTRALDMARAALLRFRGASS